MKFVFGYICLLIIKPLLVSGGTYPNFVGQSLNQVNSNPEWQVLNMAEGDLNNDTLNDIVVILESRNGISETRDGEKKNNNKARILLVLIKNEHGSVVLGQNNFFIARQNEGSTKEEIEPEILIRKCSLQISYVNLPEQISYKFEFVENDLIIIEAERGYVSAGTGEYGSEIYDFERMEIKSEVGSVESDKVKKETIPMLVNQPKSLFELNEMYTWKITNSCSL